MASSPAVSDGSTESETLAILVEVSPVAYLRLNSNLKLYPKDRELRSLPMGYAMEWNVSFHDSLGRKFQATNNLLEYRPNRYVDPIL